MSGPQPEERDDRHRRGPADRQVRNPVISGRRTAFQHAMIYVFVAVPMVALVAAVPLVWGWGVGLARPACCSASST